MKAIALVSAVALLAAGCGGSSARTVASTATPAPAPPCRAARVHQPPYPGHGKGLDGIAWIKGSPEDAGLVGLLWYWPPNWRHVRRARIYTGGEAPQGWSTKILWAFLDPAVKHRAGAQLFVHGRRLDGPGSFRADFEGIGYEGQRGAPSYASIIEVPKPGCWRLTLTTGHVTATVDLRAVKAQ